MAGTLADTLNYYPGKCISPQLDPGVWELYHKVSHGPPPPFLEAPRADMIAQPHVVNHFMNNWIFWILLGGFAILTMIRYYHEKRLRLFGAAIFKRSAAVQLIRESPVWAHRSFLPLMLVYIISVTLLIHQSVEIFSPPSEKGIQILLVFLGFLGIYIAFSIIKIFTIWLISVIFKNVETAREYIQNILIFNLVMGILLLPLLLLIVYTYHEVFLYITAGFIVIMIVLRFLRGIAIGLSDPKFSLLHLFLYLCTLEILPVLFAAKLVSKYFFSG